MLLIVFFPIISSNSCLKLFTNWSMFEIAMLPMVALIVLVYLKQSISCLNGFVHRSLDDILHSVFLVCFVLFASYDTKNGAASSSIISLLLISVVCLFMFTMTDSTCICAYILLIFSSLLKTATFILFNSSFMHLKSLT